MPFTLQTVVTWLITASPALVVLLPYLLGILLHYLPANQHALLLNFAEQAVKFAEQAGGTNAQKKQLAMQAVTSLCKRFHVNASPEVLGLLIDAAVNDLPQLVPQVDLEKADTWLNDVSKQATALTPVYQQAYQAIQDAFKNGLPVIPNSLSGSQETASK